MIELTKFLALLRRNILILIVIPVVTVVITFFLVRRLPSEYISKTRIATGLVDQSEKNILDNLSFLQESKIDQDFGNIIQVMQLKKVYDQVSYQLILHDLIRPDSAFRSPSKLVKDLNRDAIRHAVKVYSELYEKSEPLVLWDKDQAGLKQVLVSMGYDEESLKSKMAIYRVNRSDYIDVECRTENPLLSAFVVNQLTSEFLKFYNSVNKNNQVRSVVFLDSLRKTKQGVLEKNMEDLKSYKIRNHILNLDEQAKVLYGQIADIETRLEVARKDVDAYNGVIGNIDSKFDPADKQFVQTTTRKINQDIILSTNQLKTLTDAYVRSNYDPSYKSRIDSLRNIISSQINESADRYTMSPLTTKENLVVQKINAQVALDMAKYSMQSLEKEIVRLNKVVGVLVPHEATIQAFEEKIDVASKEYLEALNKYNQVSLTSSLSTSLRQIELGMPGAQVPSKKMLLVILSGIISFTFCILILFVLFYIDSNIKTTHDLARETGIHVLGSIPFMGLGELDLRRMWNGEYDITRTETYKSMIRAIRFEISDQLGESRSLVITSIQPGEGKTFAALNIAYAFSRVGKKILLIDGNFDQPDLTGTIHADVFLEDYLQGRISAEQLYTGKQLTLIGNRGGDVSLFEVTDEATARRKIQQLTQVFDLVLIDASSLKGIGKSREWVSAAEKVIAVYEAGASVAETEKKTQVGYLLALQQKFAGWLLNKVDTGLSRKRKRK
jgi:succinoglycan biosynthesis transport protein ExoP